MVGAQWWQLVWSAGRYCRAAGFLVTRLAACSFRRSVRHFLSALLGFDRRRLPGPEAGGGGRGSPWPRPRGRSVPPGPCVHDWEGRRVHPERSPDWGGGGVKGAVPLPAAALLTPPARS